MVWRPDRHSSHAESAKIKHLIVPYTRGAVLDVGSGPNRVFPHFLTLDSGKDFGGARVADMPAPGDTLPMFADAIFDAVFSSHFLEHVEDYRAALKEWWRVLRLGGHLVLYLPHKDLYPRCGTPGANPDHKHDFGPEDILAAFNDFGFGADVVEEDVRDQGDEYSFFLVLRKTPSGKVMKCCGTHDRNGVYMEAPQAKKALVIRYGALGDQLIAGSIAKPLKAEGYHVTWMCTPRGEAVLRHNPHIDAFWVQDENQVPNHELGPYWAALAREGRWDRIINLCESLEGSLLQIKERIGYSYGVEARRRIFGTVNYLERTHDIAGLPHQFDQRFYPSRDESAWARDERAKIKGKLVLWALAGSSIHKAYPWVDRSAVELLAQTDAHILFVGDEACQHLELAVTDLIEQAQRQQRKDWLSRLHFRSGRWNIRQTFAFITAMRADDIVVGPETGVMNAAAFEAPQKLLMLSHSSARNIGSNWPGCTTIAAPSAKAPCQPCHQMHYGFDTCVMDAATGASLCTAHIEPRDVFLTLLGMLYPAQAGASRAAE